MADANNFFENVENYRPMREGRSAKTLVKKPLDTLKLHAEVEEARRQLEIGKDRDALHAYTVYIKKMKELFPSSRREVDTALYDAAMFLHKDERILNEPKLLNIFLELADKQEDPRETFEFMKENRVGQELPKFHLAMAAAYERAKDFKTAEQCYTEGLHVAKRQGSKEDLDLANTHLSHFKRRMARRLQESRAQNKPSSPEVRATLLPRAGSHARPPLTSARSPLYKSGLGTAMNSVRQPSRSAQFTVFEDRKAGPSAQKPTLRPPEATWTKLETEATAVENHGPVRPWNEVGTLPQRPGASTAMKKPSFQIWTELETEEQPRRSSPSFDEAMDHMGKLTISEGEAQQSRKFPEAALATPAPLDRSDDRTINTKYAYNDMYEMFASPSMSVSRRGPQPRPIYTPAVGLRDDLPDEGQNVSPNVVLRPGETARRSTLRRPASARPALAVIEHREEEMSPSFRQELRFPPPAPQESFRVFQDTPIGARNVTNEGDEDGTFDGTLGISRVLAFDPLSVRRPPRGNREPTTGSVTAPSFQIFKD